MGKRKTLSESFDKGLQACVGWRSTLTSQDENRLRKVYGIPNNVNIRFPANDERVALDGRTREVCVDESMFIAGVRLPFLPVIQDLLAYLGLAPSQVKPNGWRYLISSCVLWPLVLGKPASLTAKEFLYLYQPIKYDDWTWTFQTRKQTQNKTAKFLKMSTKWSNVKVNGTSFFFISGDGLFSPKDEGGVLTGRVPYIWGPGDTSSTKCPKLSPEEDERVKAVVNWGKKNGIMMAVEFLTADENLEKYLGIPYDKEHPVNPMLDLTIQDQGKGKEKFGEDPPHDAQKANVCNPSSPTVVIRSPIKIARSSATGRGIGGLLSGAKPAPKPRVPLLSAVAYESASFVNSASDCLIEGSSGEASPLVSREEGFGVPTTAAVPTEQNAELQTGATVELVA